MTDSVSDSPLKVLHKTMITAGYGDVPKDYNSFERTLTQQGEAGTKVRLQLHKRLVKDKLLTDVPEDYNTFASTLFKPVSKPQPQATAQSATQSAAPTEGQPSQPVQSQQQSASAEEQTSPSQYTTQMATANPTVAHRMATVGERNVDVMPSRLGVSLEDDRPTASAEQAPQSVQLPGRDRLWELAQKQADLGDRRSLATRVKDLASKGQLYTSNSPFSVTPSINDAPMTAMGKVEAIRQARQRMAAQKRMSDPEGLDKLVNATVDEAVQRAEKQSQEYDRAFGIAPTSATAASEIAKGAHRQAVLESETDVNKLTEQVLNKMQPDIEVMRDTMLADGKTTDEVMTALNTYIGETVPNAVLNALRKRNAPKSTLDYVLGTAYNSWLSTALTNTIARNMRGGEQSYSLGGLSAAAELEEYGKSLEATKGKVASMAYGALGGGLGMITDPSNALSMMVGAGVFNAAKPVLTKSASGLIARSTVTKGTQKATQQALMHILPNTKAYQAAMKIGQSGASFAGFEVNSQLKADLNSGTFGGMDYAKAVGRGLVLGGATAGFGQVVDYGFKALGKGTKALSTKIGASERAANIMAGTEQIAGKVVVAPVVEAGVFTGGSMLLEDKPLGEYSAAEIGDLYGSNLAFIIAMKGLNLPKTIVNSAIGPDAVPFFESVRHDIANPGKALERIGANIDNIGDNALTDSEWREVNEVLGYDIRTLKGAVKAATEQNYQGKDIVNLYKGLSDVMTSDALTLQQKAVVSRMFGQRMKAMPVLGVKMEKDNDSGTYVVTALDPTGTAIRRLKYTKEQDAESSYNVLVKAANVNHMDILEASVANGYKGDGSDADPELPKKLWLKACAEAGYDGKLTARQLEAQGDPTTAGQGGRALSKYKFMLAEMVSRKKHTSDTDAVVETYDGKTHQVVETVADEDGQHYICLDDDGKHIDIHESNVKNVASTPKAEEVLAADEASVLDGEVFGFSNEQTIEQLAQGQEAPMSYRECAYLAIKEAKGTLTPEEAERCKAYTREQLDYYRSKYGYETEGEQRARIDEEAAKRGKESTEATTAEETPAEEAKTEVPTEEEIKPTEEAPVKAETPTISQESDQVSDQVGDQHKPLPSEVAEPKERAKALLDEVNGDKEAAKEVADKAIARAKKRLDELDKAESVDEATDITNAKERQALKAEIDKWEQTKAELDAPTPEAVTEEAEPAPADGMVDELDALQAEVRNRQIATRIPSEVNEALQKLRVDVFGMADDENVNGLSSDGKIYVNVDRKSGKREVWIVGHEIGHIMDSRNPEAYSIVRKRANDWLRANVGEIGYAARVENVMSKYRQHIEDVLFDKYSASMSESAARARAVQESMDMVTREYIETEIANDILGDLIQNPETAKKMFKDAPSTASAKFFQAVRDFFRNLKERLYGTLGISQERDINRVIRAFNDMYQKEVAKVMEDAEAVRGDKDIEAETANYSIDTTFHAAGLRYVKDEQGKNRMFEDRGLLGEGKEIKPEDLTVEYMKKTPLGAIVQGAVKYGTMSQPQATKALENFLGIVKAIADTPDPEMFHALSTAIAYGSGYSSDPTKRDYYQLRPDGRLQFVPMKSNSEKQYNTTFDVTTICRKTQYIIDEISRQQKLLKRGLTPQEMVKVVYDTVYKTGEGNVLVPCAVCYVFNRWVNLGGVFNTMWRLDNKYRDVSVEDIQAERDELDRQFDEGGYHYMMDEESAKRYEENRDTMVNGKTKTAREAAAKYVKAYEEVRAKMKQLGLNGKIGHDRDRYDEFVEMSKNKELSSEDREQYKEWVKWMDDRRKAVIKESLKYADQRVFELESREIDNDIVTNQVLDLKAKLKTLNKGTKDYETTKNKIKDVQKKYKPLTDFEVGELERLKQLQDIAGKMTWFDYVRLQDDYKPIDADVLFDINRSNDFKMKYPGAWKYRTTRGSGMGKAANAYSAEVVGSTVVAKGGKKIEGKHDPSVVANNIFALRDENGNMRAVDENGDLTPEARTLILQAIDNSAAQNYLSGQRLQSTSDYRTEYFTDYVLHLYQQAAIGSAAQGFTKVPESGKLFGDSGACVNLSLIAKGKGFHEVEGPEEDPNAIQDIDGKWYVLDFSDASGINHTDAFNLIKAYDNIQGIIVAMSPKHARLCLRDPRIRFVIPYHISGDSFDLFNSKMATIGEDVATGDTGDYTKTQEDHISSNSAEKKMARGIVEKIKKGQKLKEEEYNLLATKGNMPKDMSKITTGEGAGSDSEYWMIRCLYMRFRGEDIDGSEARIPNNFLRPEDWGENGFGNFDSLCRIKEWNPKTGEYTGKYKQIIMNGDQASLLMPNDFWDNLTVFEKEPREGYRDASVNNQQFFAWCETLGIRPRFSGRDKDGKKMYFTNAEGIKESYDLTGEKNYWQTLIDIPMYGNDGERYCQRPIDASKIGAQHMDENYTTNLETAEGTVQLHPMAGTPMEGSPMAQKITAAVRDRLLETNIKELDDFAKLIRRRRTTAVNKATKQGPQAQDWSTKEMKKVPGWLRTEWETDPTLRKAIADGTHREWFKQRFGDAVVKTNNEKVRKLLGIKESEGPEDPDFPDGPKGGGKPKAEAVEAASMAEADAPRYSILTEEKKNATVANKTADKLGVKARTVREHEMPEAERTGRKAWVDEQTSEVVVDLDRVGDSKDVKSAVAHALADGKSLGEMFKGDALQSIYDAIGKGTDGKTAIAKLAVNNESGKAAKDWKKAVASARIAIKKATGIEFDNTDIEQLLYKEAQGKQGNPVVKAKQIAAGEDYKANHLFDGVARVPEGMVTSERVPRFSISTEGEGTTASVAGDLDALRRRIRKSTKDELKANAEIVRAYLKDRLSPAMATRFGKRKILKIANEIERATTLSKRSLQNAIDEAEMTIGDSEVKTALDAMMTVLNTPTMRVNSRKQQVANKVDADTVTFFADIKGILKDVRKNNLSEKEIEIRDMIKENEAEAERIRKEADDQGRVLTATELDTLATIAEENKQLEKERTAAREERRTIEEMLRGDDIQTATERLLQLQNNPNRTAAENRELAALPFRIRLTALQSKLLQYQNKKTLPDDSEAEARLQALKDLGNYDDVVEQYLNYMQATPRARRAARIQQQRELMYEIADITRQLNDILENGHEVYQRWVQNIANHDSALLTSAVAAVSNPKKAPLQPSQQTAAMEQARGQKYSVVKSFFHGFYDTFNHMTQMIEASALPKEGFMYNYFITDPDHGWNALQGRYKDMLYEYRKRVTDTMEQMIGKDEMNRYNDTKRITLTLRDSEGNVLNQFEREYTIGQLLYEYLLSRMAKGKTRLEMMGFDETAQLEVEKALGSRYMDFGDWVSEELLNDLYQEQNKTYKRLNGINLGRVEHYFPFRYTREEISQPGNLVEEYVQSLTSGISSEKHRTDNNHAFDLTRDAMSLLDKTIENGCRQATFGEFNRDLSVLLSSAEFMNALKNRGHDLDKRWTEVCNIAAGIDKSVKDAELQNYINRMLSGSVIAFRINTALKQLLSAPAFMLEHGFDPQWQLDLAKATIRQLALGTDSQTVKWCMDNLPLFRARWNDQNMGDIRMIDETLGTVSSKLRRGGKFNPSAIGQKVMDTSSKVTAAGMIPNRAIDMFTCAIGAKAQYDYSLRKYRNAIGAQLDILKANTPEENWNEAEARKSLDKWAHNKALMEAEQIYNESQQSSQGAYVSPLQRLGTNWARILTLFKTASLSYARKGIEGLVTSSRAARGLGAVEPIFIPGIGEQDQPFVMTGRGKYKGVRRATKAMEGLAQASMFLIGLGMAWNLGGLFTAGYAPVSAEEYINNISDDEANVTMTAALLSNSPLAESLIAAAGGQSKAQMSDALIIDYARKFKDATAAEGIKLGLQVAAQVGLGIKTDTWTNMLTGIDGMISDGTIDYTDIQFILNSPPSQGIYRTARAMEGERLKNGEIGMSQYISKMLFAKACNDVGEEGNWWDSRKDYKDSDIDKVLDAYRKRMYPSLAEYKAPADKDADIEEEKGKIEVYDTALKVMNTVRKAYVSRDPNAKEIADNAHALLMQLMDGSEEQAAYEDKLQQYRKAYLESLKVKREQGDAAYEEYMGANGVAVDKGNEYRALKAEITSALNSMFRGDISQDEAVGIIKAVREEIKNIE